MQYEISDVQAGVWSAAIRVAGPRGSVKEVVGELENLTRAISRALDVEAKVQWNPAGVRFASEILASTILIRRIQKEESWDGLAEGRLPDWIKVVINRWWS